jgi:hypothetical protein
MIKNISHRSQIPHCLAGIFLAEIVLLEGAIGYIKWEFHV